ncbi:MAG: GAF domain-containing protein [Chloroflexi bacterium]|nr:GAF domain-containing protein [Chloroflexota bacterium]
MKFFGFRRDEALGRTCDQVPRCHDLRSYSLSASRCAAVESVRTGLPAPTCQILVRDRAGRALGVLERVLLVPAGAERRALLSFTPIPSGVVGPTPWAGGPLAGGPEWIENAPDLDATLDRLLAAVEADAAEVFITAPVGRQMMLASHRGLASRSFREITCFEPGSGFPGLVAQTGEPLLSFDLPHDDRYLRTQVKRRGFRSYLCVPVANESGFFGSLHIASRKRDYDLASRLPLLAAVARGLATALEVTRFRVAQPIAVHLPSELGADADLWRTADLVLRTLMEHTASAGGTLLLLGGEPRALGPVVERGSPSHRRGPSASGDPRTCPALQQRQPIFDCQGPGVGAAGCGALRCALAATLCLPLEAGGKLLGVATVGWERSDSLPSRRLIVLHGALRAGGVALHRALVALQWDRAGRRPQVLPQPTADLDRDWLGSLGAPHSPGSPDSIPITAGEGVRAEALAEDRPERPLLSLHCLGHFRILRDGREVPAEVFGRRQPLTLLKILLASYGRPVSRDRLVDILWPEEPPPDHDAVLNLIVHRLRRALEPEAPTGQPSRFIRRIGDEYLFDPSSTHRLDSREFSEAAALAAQLEAEGRPGDAREAYLKAGALYAGDFLEDDPDSVWCLAERERLRERFLTVVRRLAHRYYDEGDADSAIAWCRRALAVDETLEELHRGLMEALWRAGRRGEALRQYQLCCAVLARELDVAPSAETRALYQRIADG